MSATSSQPIVVPRTALPAIPGISKSSVTEAIHAAQLEFEWAWNVVRQLKHFDLEGKDFGKDFLSFQPRMFETIVHLEAFRRSIRTERKRLRRDAKRYRPVWLKRRYAALDRYETALTSNLAIGRAIGDGFAWWFYEKDRRLIDQHLQHPKQADIPTGIGGLGERLLVKGIPSLGGKIAIYHGTTTFLRIGDVSFVDVSSRRVHLIAELKTKKISEIEYRLMLNLVTGSAEVISEFAAPPGAAPPPPAPEEEPLRDVMRERLEVQMRRMGNAVREARDRKPNARFGKPGEFYFEQLADVVRHATSHKFNYVTAGSALVLGALRRGRGRSYASDISSNKRDVTPLISSSPEWAMKVLLPDRADNALIIGTPGFGDELTVASAGLPVSWWPMDWDSLSDILFGRVMLLSLYNPAPLRAALENLGFTSDPGGSSVSRTMGKRVLKVEAIRHFDRLTAEMFMSTESVVEMIKTSVDAALAQAGDRPIKVSIHAQVTTGDDAYENDVQIDV